MRGFHSLLTLCLLLPAQLLSAQDAPASLSAIVDQHLAPPSGLAVASCSDAEFLRRVSLDLVGMTPTVAETRAFLADSSPDKRAKLVDQLLASPRFTRHLATTIDLWLMERRANPNVPQDEWYAWLLKSLREGKGWNALVREILTADGSDPATRPASRFYVDRGSEPNPIARDIGRIFFGRDMQCAQCHDHPLVDDYKQADYHGLLAFVAPGYVLPLKNGDKQINIHAEKAGSDLQFESVFIKGTMHRTPPRLPSALLTEEPNFYPGEEYTVAPADNVKPVPKYSRIQVMAEQATNGSNRLFNENIANRLWAHMFGRGLVYPLDMHHPDNPPTDPALMRILGERIAASNFDMRSFLRELALSQAYQRPFDAPADLMPAATQAPTTLTQLEAERATIDARYTEAKAAYDKAVAAYAEAEKAFLPVVAELDTARTKSADARKALDTAQAAVAEAQKQLAAKQDIVTALTAASTAAQAAAQKLPNDAELMAAAQKFADRTKQTTDEVPALQKSVEEKTAAVAAPSEAYTASKATIDAAIAKVQPFKDTLKQKDVELLTARRAMQDNATDLAAIDARITTTKTLAKLSTTKQAIEESLVALTTRKSEQQAAQAQVAAFVPTMNEREANLVLANNAMTTATEQLTAAQDEQSKHAALLKDLSTATSSAEAAQAKVPGDTVLADATSKLKERLASIQAEAATFQAKVDAANTQLVAANTGLDAAKKQRDEASAEMARLDQVVATATTAIQTTEAECTRLNGELQKTQQEIIDNSARGFSLATLKALTPEQLLWSIFQVTGVNDRYLAAEAAELDKTAPLTDAQKQAPAAVAARQFEIEQRAFDKLKGNLAPFIQYYAAGAGQPQGDFFATADQALFAGNSGYIVGWVTPTSGNVTEKMANEPDPNTAADELYMTILSRPPTEAEKATVAQVLSSRSADKAVAAQELAWGLLNSAEFRFNH
ncbi:MAG: DUF1549 domain-containing protein [Planctomycetaceae bacterium]